MATSYTTNLGLALPVTGELAGAWGDVVNQEITALLDNAVAGTTTLSSDADVTLTDTDGAANQSRQAILLWTANGTVTRTITAPARTKAYIVINATAGTQSIKLVGAGPTTGITIAANEKCLAAWNGSDFVKVATSTAVLTVAVATTNGLAGTSSGGSTPTLTLSTTVNGMVKGDGTTLSAASAGADYLAPPSGTAILKANSGGALANATPGTDYVAPGTATTFTAQQSFTGATGNLAVTLVNAAEKVTVSATAATGTIAYYATTQSVLYYTSNAAANWTINLTGNGSTTLNTLLATGQAITVVHLVTQGTTPYYNNVVQVDGTTSGVTTKWQGLVPTAGSPSGIDSYTYTVIKTGSATFTVLASQTAFV